MPFVSSKNFLNTNFKLLNILFFCFPIAFLIGNGVTNIVTFLVCLIGIFAFSNKLYLIKNSLVSSTILAFFIILFSSTLLDVWEDPKNDHFFKSISYFRYFFLFLVTSFFIESEKFNFKYFLISSFVCILFLSLDIIYQFINGSDIFGFKGYESSKYHLSGFLKDEYIAGAYIQKFFIFSLVLFPFFLKKLENKKFIISIFLTIIFFTGILYSGNRIPLMMFIFSMFFIMIFIKNLRFPIVIGALFCSIIFYTSIKNNENLKSYYISFYSNVIFIADSIKKYSFEEYPELENKKGKRFVNEVRKKDTEWVKKYKLIPYASGHAVTYLTAIDLWTDSPIIGNGIKSFRIKCLNKLYLPNRNCQTHPHNYYLELLNDTGLVGTLFLLFAIFFLLKNKFLNFKYYKKKEKLLAICIFIIIISEFFPIRSTGSFFSTYNSSFIFFVLGILNGLKKIKI